VAQRLADKKIALQLEDSGVTYLGRQGYDPLYGARCGPASTIIVIIIITDIHGAH
jgi:ATP-dependent Clp protease ATP-binding subunit ClpA